MSRPEPSPLAQPVEKRFAHAEALADALAAELESCLLDGIHHRNRASLALSGGSTPLPLFRRLRDRPLPWSKVTVTLADERWVDHRHADSNAAFLHRELLVGPAAAATFIDLKNSAPTPELGETECETELAKLDWPLDAIILGMGGDGHTASLFPATPENRSALEAGLDPASKRRCVAIRPGEAPHPRISLTLNALTETRRLILHITGTSKWNVYQEALRPGPVGELPIRAVLRQTRVPIEVFWSP